MQLKITRNTIIGFGFIVVYLLFVIISLLHRGLFFTPAKTYTMSVLALIGLIGVIVAGFFVSLQKPRWLLFLYGYAGYALLTTLWAADPSLAVNGAVMIVAITLFVTFAPLLNTIWRQAVLLITAVSGVVVYLFAMGVQFGVFSFNQAIQSGMMDSVFQYHNTFGSYELAAALMAIFLGLGANKYVWRAVYMGIALFNLYGVVASYSRWVWIATVIMLVVTLVLTRLSQNRLNSFLYAALTFLAAGLGAPFVIKSIHSGSAKAFAVAVVVAIVLAAAIPFGLAKLDKVANVQRRRIYAFGSLAVPIVLGIILLVVEKSATAGLFHRVDTIQLHSTSLQGRFWYYGAAWKMWLSNPLFGSGYNTWQAKFQAFEQFNYWSTETHSTFFDQLVNFGVIGTLLWLGAIGYAVYTSVKAIRMAKEGRMAYLGALVAALALLLHAIFDFDFDFPYVFSIFIILLAVATGPGTSTTETVGKLRRWWIVGVGGVMGLIVAVWGTGLAAAQTTLGQLSQVTSATQQAQSLQSALALAPYDTTVQLDLVQVYYNLYLQTHETQYQNLAWTYAHQAARTGYYNPSVMRTVAVLAYQLHHYPEALSWGKQTSLDGPFTIQYQSAYMGIALWVGAHEYQVTPSAARKLFQATLLTYDQLNVNIDKLNTLPTDVASTQAWSLQLDAPTQVYAATAEYCLGHYHQSLADVQNWSTTNRDSVSTGLYQIVTDLDHARLQHKSVAGIAAQLAKQNPQLSQEFSVLVNM